VTPWLTPVERHGDIWLKRDDLYLSPGGAIGGKARSCAALAAAGTGRGLVTAGAKSSPQVSIVARVGAALGLPVRVHTPAGVPGPEIVDAVAAGAVRVIQSPGYSNVVAARARADAERLGWTLIPYGMDTPTAVVETAAQTANIPADARRVVIPVGSGMSMAGVIAGLRERGRTLEVVGVVVGADPRRRLGRYVPVWPPWASLVAAGVEYDVRVTAAVGGVVLDPVYEAKVVPFLQPGDLLWIVGRRMT
jgi:1-aminocyclopropane-1-carboxylate deaminase/D-cysteine desulfhydrase-like pyridoxal-dependent ACC family enzyme